MNIVIYARFSSHSQSESSIEGQLKVCHEFSKRNNYVVIGEYIDRAITGTNDNRAEFLKMIADSKKKQFQGILVYAIDRFGRNLQQSTHYEYKLQKNGVVLLSATENFADNPAGKLHRNMMMSFAQYYSDELSTKIIRGMTLSANKCQCTGGNVALGYKVDSNKHFQIDESTAPTVVKIFEMYAEGQTVEQITFYLNSQQVKTSRGSAFNKNSLRKMLRNKRYISIYTYKEVEVAGGIPRIVSDELFNEVQKMLERNKKAPARARAKEEYILTTKLFCGKCREMMTGVSGTSKTKKIYNYYTCNGAKKKTCHKKPVQKEYIENLVVDECRKLLTDENIEIITHKTIALCEREKENSDLKQMNKLLKDCSRKMSNLITAISECDIDSVRKAMYAEVARLETEKQKIEKQIALEQGSQLDLNESEVKFFLTQLRKGNINELKYRKTLINVFVVAIYLYDDKITYIFTVGDKTVQFDEKLLNDIEQANSDDLKSSFMSAVAPPCKLSFSMLRVKTALWLLYGGCKAVLQFACPN